MTKQRRRLRAGHAFEGISSQAAAFAGSSWAFSLAAAVVVLWAVTGPVFGFSSTWQLMINTTTTIVTFLMVFLIQRSQNKDALAVQLKLNELVAVMKGASNRLIDVEDLGEEELAVLHAHFRKLAAMAKRNGDLASSHSIEEAEERHARKAGS